MDITEFLSKNKELQDFLLFLRNSIELQTQDAVYEREKNSVELTYAELTKFLGGSVEDYLKYLEKNDILKLSYVIKFKHKNGQVPDDYYRTEAKPADSELLFHDDFFNQTDRRYFPINFYPQDIFAFKFDEKLLRLLGELPQKKNEENKNSDEKDILTIKLKNGRLIINKDTGLVKLNNTENEFIPDSKEYNTILKLATGKNYKATYEDLLKGNASKVNKRGLSFVIRDIKRGLSILPAKKAKNKDIIRNLRGIGYRLIT